MAAGFPVKDTFANGDVYSASDVNDLAGTVNLIKPTAKGDMFSGSAANTYTKVTVGTNGQLLTADSTAAGGVAWKTPAGNAGPTFSAYLSASQTITSASTYTKVALNTENWDTDNAFDTTNNRFTPLTAGYYQINMVGNCQNNARFTWYLYKNGSIYQRFFDFENSTTYSMGTSTMVYMNGTTDYIELYVWATGSSRSVTGTSQYTILSGIWIRS